MTDKTALPSIDRDRALALLRQAVEQKGEDYVYPSGDPYSVGTKTCTYERDGEPSCLVGHVLFIAGVPVEVLARLDQYGETEFRTLAYGSTCEDDDGNEEVLQEPVLHEYAALTEEAVEALSAAQDTQDRGRTWGQALLRAINPDAPLPSRWE